MPSATLSAASKIEGPAPGDPRRIDYVAAFDHLRLHERQVHERALRHPGRTGSLHLACGIAVLGWAHSPWRLHADSWFEAMVNGVSFSLLGMIFVSLGVRGLNVARKRYLRGKRRNVAMHSQRLFVPV